MSADSLMPGVEVPAGGVVSDTEEVSSSSGRHADELDSVSWPTGGPFASDGKVLSVGGKVVSYADVLIRGPTPGLMFPRLGKGGKGGHKGGKGGPTEVNTWLEPNSPPMSHPAPGVNAPVQIEEVPSDHDESEEVSTPTLRPLLPLNQHRSHRGADVRLPNPGTRYSPTIVLGLVVSSYRYNKSGRAVLRCLIYCNGGAVDGYNYFVGDYEQSGYLGLLNRATIRFALPRGDGPPEILSFVDSQRNRITSGPKVSSLSLVTEALDERSAPYTMVKITDFNSGPDQKNGLVPNHGFFIGEGMSVPLKFVYKQRQWAASDLPVPGTTMRAFTLAKMEGEKYYIEFYRLRADPRDLDKLRNFVVPPTLHQPFFP